MCGKTMIQTHEYEHDDVIIRPSGSWLRYILVVDTGPVSVQKVVLWTDFGPETYDDWTG